MTPNGETKNKEEVMYLTRFRGKDGELICDIQTAKPVVVDTSNANEPSILIGTELVTFRFGLDKFIDGKCLWFIGIEQLKIGET